MFNGNKIIRSLFLTTLVTSLTYATGDPLTVGGIAEKITGSFENIGKLIFSIAYVAGLGFGVAAIFKFKQHKDNPTQVPIGTPIALIAISSALVFFLDFTRHLARRWGLNLLQAVSKEVLQIYLAQRQVVDRWFEARRDLIVKKYGKKELGSFFTPKLKCDKRIIKYCKFMNYTGWLFQ